jgi:hypothetical protein
MRLIDHGNVLDWVIVKIGTLRQQHLDLHEGAYTNLFAATSVDEYALKVWRRIRSRGETNLALQAVSK